MKKFMFALMLVAAVKALSIMSFNIKTGIGMDGVLNLNRTIEAIRAASPDLVGLQEVDDTTTRTPFNETKLMAEALGMEGVYGKFRNFQGGGYGVSVLSKLPIIESRIFNYYDPSGEKHPCENDSSKADYCQGAVAVLVKAEDGRLVWFITTHIGLHDMQLNEVTELMNDFVPALNKTAQPAAVFITGDFNSSPDEDAIKFAVDKAGFTDTHAVCGSGNGYTFDAANPTSRIDYIFQRPVAFKCSDISVINTQVSDHRPVIAHFN